MYAAEHGGGGGGGGGGGVDGTPASALAVRGATAVHALYNFLHNYRAADSARDVPLLLAPCPFEGATVAPLSLVAGARQRAEQPALGDAGAAEGGGGGKHNATSSRRELVYTACMRASVPGVPLGPWNVTRLCDVLRGSQDGAFAARFDPHPHTTAFNLSLPLADAAAGAAAAPPEPPSKGGYANAAERAAAREPLGWPDDFMTSLICQDGLFSRVAAHTR